MRSVSKLSYYFGLYLVYIGFGVVLEVEYNFRCMVLFCSDIFGYVFSIFVWVNREVVSEIKIGNFEFVVCVDK